MATIRFVQVHIGIFLQFLQHIPFRTLVCKLAALYLIQLDLLKVVCKCSSNPNFHR